MLNAKPRQQAIGHIIGIFSGALAATPILFLLFLSPGPDGARTPATIVSEAFPMPSAMQWKGVADLIARGLSSLLTSAIVSMNCCGNAGGVYRDHDHHPQEAFPIVLGSIGLGVILPPDACFGMWLGAMFFWWQGRGHPEPGTKGNRL